MRLLTILFFVFISSHLRTEEQNTIALECVVTSVHVGETRQTLRDKQSAFLKIKGNTGTLNFGKGEYNLTGTDELKYYFANDINESVIFNRVTLNFDWYSGIQKIYEFRCERTTRV